MESQGARGRSASASARLRMALVQLEASLEQKYNFNPNQPRRPKGTSIGGQWMSGLRDMRFGPSPEEHSKDLAEASEKFDAFVVKHEKTITRILGGLQAIGGGFEIVGGAAILGGGTVASGGLASIPAGLAAFWMITNGYENGQAGFRALVTGEPSPTNLNRLLRDLGLSEPSADTVELLLGGGGAVAGAKVGRRALEKAVEEELARRALRAFDAKLALDVRVAGRSLWDVPDIRLRGAAWEEFDVRRTGYQWTPNARAFDQISSDSRVFVSNKSLDLQRETYLRADRKALFFKIKGYIQEAATHTPRDPRSGLPIPAPQRRLHLLLRFGDSVPGQALQIAAAEQYAKEMGVILKVEYAR